MGLFDLFRRGEPEPEVLDEDEFLELMTDDMLYVEDVPLTGTTVRFRINDLRSFDSDMMLASLENLDNLPYEFRCYFDTRRAFSRALENLSEEMYYDSFEGGRSADCSAEFTFDDHDVMIEFTLSRADDDAPYIFNAEIHIDGK